MVTDADLVLRLKRHEERVAAAVQRFRSSDPLPDDAFRGLYLTDEHIDGVLRGDRLVDSEVATMPQLDPESTLGQLARRFSLTVVDVEILIIAVAPDLDRRFEQLYGYLHDDVSRRRASPGLVFGLLGLSAFDGEVRWRFDRQSPLRQTRLLEVHELDRPFLTRALRVPDRVAAHLLGHDQVSGELADALVGVDPVDHDEVGELARLVDRAASSVYLREFTDGEARHLAAAAAAAAGRPSLAIDLSRVATVDQLDQAEVAIREALLIDGVAIAGPTDELSRVAVSALADSEARVVLYGRQTWDPAIAETSVVVRHLDRPDRAQQAHRWARAAERHQDLSPEIMSDTGAEALVQNFRLGPAQIRRAVDTAQVLAMLRNRPLDAESLAEGARSQSSVGLERLARRVAADATWDDLILPPQTEADLHHLVVRVATRGVVLDSWGMRRGGGRGEGISALFVGASGTGKTLAAEVVANTLGLDLYVIDLSSVVDKYIGETEKNLDRVFGEAEGVNGVLFFDEADALFGKRSEITDAKDRYANVEVAYLLQRMEQFDGLAILASNLRGNLDEAFARRLSLIVDFADPDEAQRHRLWDSLLGRAPRSDDIDIDFLASAFDLSGGNIRNVSLTAAYLAAEADDVVTMARVIRGVQHEYKKLGRLCLASEFGPYFVDIDQSTV